MTAPTAVLAEGLVQRFGTHVALGPLDLHLERGGRLAVLGANGAGKTTLLRMLATAARPAAGRLELLGLDALRHRRALRARLGYVGHRTAVYPELTVLENLGLFGTLHGVGRNEVDAALALVGLRAAGGRRAGRLSRGQQQRLALARAVVHRPELLVLDEPDASLDEAGRVVLRDVLAGRTAVVATHDVVLARELCDRALVLHDGRQVRGPGAAAGETARPPAALPAVGRV